MIIHYLKDSDHPNTDYQNTIHSEEKYTEAFEMSLVSDIEEDYELYSVKNADDFYAISAKSDHAILTINYQYDGYVTIQSLDKCILRSVSIYNEDNSLLSPCQLSSCVSAALVGKEIEPLTDFSSFTWRLSWQLVREIKFDLNDRYKHVRVMSTTHHVT